MHCRLIAGTNWRIAMMSQGLGKRKLQVDFVDPLAIDSAVDLSAGSRTKVELTILISRLMEGEDPQALKREYSSELLEDAISALENRI
jgi:hypothetical protein